MIFIAEHCNLIDWMLVFTKLLIIFAVLLLLLAIGLYVSGYYISGNLSLRYYPKPTSASPSTASYDFVQNGATTLKYMGIFLMALFVIGIIGALVNEHLRLSEKLHHLKRSRPLH